MNKKAFTLIEIVGVIIVIGVIGLITFPVVNSTIKNTREKSYNAQVSHIIESSKKWGVKNVESLPDVGESIEVSISMLIENGFIENTIDGKLKNPINGEDMNGCVKITYSTEYNQHIYEYKEVCE